MSRLHSWRTPVTLVALVLLAMAIRATFVALPRLVRWDEAAYLMIGRSLLAGRGYSELMGTADLQQPPLVAILAALGLWLKLPIPWAAAALSQILLGSLIVLPVFAIARDFYGPKIAAIAALLTAVYPALAVSPLYWSTMTEPPYLLGCLTGIYALWRVTGVGAPPPIRKSARSWRWAVVGGLSFGLAYLTRPEAAGHFAVLLLTMIAFRWLDRKRLGREVWVSVAAAVLTFALMASPYILYVHQVTGYWTLSGKQGVTMDIAMAYANHDQAAHDRAVASLDHEGKEIMWLSTDQYSENPLHFILQDPRRFVRLVRANIQELGTALFSQDLFQPGIVMLAALGLFGRPWSRRRAFHELWLVAALIPLAALLAFFVLSRFLALAVPIVLIWVAVGLVRLEEWLVTSFHNLRPLKDEVWQRVLATLPLIFVVTCLLAMDARTAEAEIPKMAFSHAEAGQWLQQHVPAGTVLMGRDSEVGLYAGMPCIAFPNAEWSQALAYARSRGAHYLIVDEWTIKNIRPQLGMLLDTDRTPDELQFLHVAGKDSGRAVYIYRIVR